MEGLLARLVFLCVCCIFVPAQGQHCPDKWMFYHDSCYMFLENMKLSNPDAETYCHSLDENAHLSSAETEPENSFLKDMSLRLRPRDSFWISGSDAETEGTWFWYPSKDPIVFTDWNLATGEPNSYHGHDQDCIMLYGPSHGTWHDTECTDLLHPICEMRLPHGGSVVGR